MHTTSKDIADMITFAYDILVMCAAVEKGDHINRQRKRDSDYAFVDYCM